MKIGIDISQIVYEGGVSNYTQDLVKSLLKIDHKNKYILFGTSLRRHKSLNNYADELKNYKNVNFKFYYFPISLFSLFCKFSFFFTIEKLIGNIDIFHSSDWIQPPTKQSTATTTTIHDMISYVFPSSMHKKILTNQKSRLKDVKKHVDVIITDSQTTKEDVIKFLNLDSEKVKIVYLAPSPGFKPQDENKVNETLEKYKIKKPYILSVSTQEPRKNIQQLTDAFIKIKKYRSEINLVLTGKYGWGTITETEMNPEGIIKTGYISQEDLVNLYCGCKVFIYPSLYEGFGLPILEAMACGVPVITSNNSSMKEIGQDVAILVDPRNERQIIKAIDLVLNLNLENYHKLVRASLSRSRLYSWQKCAKETLKIFEETVNNHENRT